MAADGFFDRYFEALDGDDPHSALDLVSDDLQFAILYAAGTDSRSRQVLGGVDELRAFTEAGDMEGWGHHILSSSRPRSGPRFPPTDSTGSIARRTSPSGCRYAAASSKERRLNAP